MIALCVQVFNEETSKLTKITRSVQYESQVEPTLQVMKDQVAASYKYRPSDKGKTPTDETGMKL